MPRLVYSENYIETVRTEASARMFYKRHKELEAEMVFRHVNHRYTISAIAGHTTKLICKTCNTEESLCLG